MKAYCEQCNKIRDVIEKQLEQTFNVKGIMITATIRVLICTECNEEVWDEEIEKENEKIVFSIYREKMHLLSQGKIKAMRVRKIPINKSKIYKKHNGTLIEKLKD